MPVETKDSSKLNTRSGWYAFLSVTTVLQKAKNDGAADDRRRSNVIRSTRTLNDLHEFVKANGSSYSRSSVHLHLAPRRVNSIEGRRHKYHVPVKIAKPTNSSHHRHTDALFCRATINHLEYLASLIDPDNVFFLSQDDKAKVPIEVPAVAKQSTMVMSSVFRVRLPDHDFVIAPKHSLIPSVYAACCVTPLKQDQGHVGYSGPTFVAVRSAKHDSSSAFSHARDFDRLLSLDALDSIAKIHNEVKPGVWKM